jgi:eukaryotic-like serine/threonine-protein kinase
LAQLGQEAGLRTVKSALADHFQDGKLLEKGGFGEVWRAVAPGGIMVAVKFPTSKEPEVLGRFGREVKLQSDLNHINVTEILDFDLDADPPWCAMPLAKGNLATHIKQPGVTANQVVDLLRQAIAGVRYAHDNHVLHRDLKPNNVLVFETPTGTRATIADFGLSRQFTRERMPFQTKRGEAYGSPWYAAPEQYDHFRDVTVTADVFSVGRIIQYCLNMRPDVAAAFPALAHCVTIATREESDERFESIAQLADAFEISATSPNSLVRPIDQVHSAANRALANPDDAGALGELMLVLEQHSGDYMVLQGMFSRLPYELFDRIVTQFPGQIRAVLREYVASLSDALPFDAAVRARKLLDHCMSELKDMQLRAVALGGLVVLAAKYDMREFSDLASGWVRTETDPVILAHLLLTIDEHPGVVDWLRVRLDEHELQPALLERMRDG